MLSVLGPQSLELRLEFVGNELRAVLFQRNLFDVYFVRDICDDGFVAELLIRYDVQSGKRLSVLYIDLIAASSAQRDRVQNDVHIAFERLVLRAFVRNGELTQMNAFGRVVIEGAH